MTSKVVARKKDGTLIKGTTSDFSPNKNLFRVHSRHTGDYNVHTLKINELKAVFFVKKIEGDKISHDKPQKANKLRFHTIGRHIKVFFHDGEIIEGLSHSPHLDNLGFFMTPVDVDSNNERIFVVLQSVEKIMVDDQTFDFPFTREIVRFCHVCGNRMEAGWKYCPYDAARID